MLDALEGKTFTEVTIAEEGLYIETPRASYILLTSTPFTSVKKEFKYPYRVVKCRIKTRHDIKTDKLVTTVLFTNITNKVNKYVTSVRKTHSLMLELVRR
jgi:hypothetical protein